MAALKARGELSEEAMVGVKKEQVTLAKNEKELVGLKKCINN
jgi:hypothetical protein